MSVERRVPSLFEWMGGMPALERLTQSFYARVPSDALLGPVFAGMSADHPRHVAEFLAEVLGGPAAYSELRGGHAQMIRHHLGRALTQQQRRRWVELLLLCADDIGVPDDPEFRSALVGTWNGARAWRSSIHSRVRPSKRAHPCPSGGGVSRADPPYPIEPCGPLTLTGVPGSAPPTPAVDCRNRSFGEPPRAVRTGRELRAHAVARFRTALAARVSVRPRCEITAGPS